MRGTEKLSGEIMVPNLQNLTETVNAQLEATQLIATQKHERNNARARRNHIA